MTRSGTMPRGNQFHMNSRQSDVAQPAYTIVSPAPHTLHECRTVEDFLPKFEVATGHSAVTITDDVLRASAARALFLVGSLPLGMGTSGSDIDLIVLVDSQAALLDGRERQANSDQRLEFSSESDLLLAGTFLMLKNGIAVEVQVALTGAVRNVYGRLRRRGPELSETEIRTLGRLSTGWLLWETDSYLRQSAVDLRDSSLAVYCSTRSFVSALLQRGKAARALERHDIPLALHHGRLSTEEAYLAYFASEGLPHLGSKWPAQLGHAHGAAKRLAEHPILAQGIPLLFPRFSSSAAEVGQYLRDASDFVMSMRALIERQVLFRIAYAACPQIALV
jgi:hypothetical protein